MPHRAMLHTTLEEAWNHVKLDVSTFRVFGSPAWALIPGEKRKDMEKRSEPLIFVGYYEDMKAFRLFDPISKDVLFQRVVHFNEHFNPTSSPTPSTNCHIVDGANHANCFSFIEQEDDEHFVAKNDSVKMKIIQKKIFHQHQHNISNLNKNNWGRAFMSERGLIDMTMSQPISIIFPLTLAILSHKQLLSPFWVMPFMKIPEWEVAMKT